MAVISRVNNTRQAICHLFTIFVVAPFSVFSVFTMIEPLIFVTPEAEAGGREVVVPGETVVTMV